MTKFVVVGSGIVGLYTTYSLLDKNVPARDVTIIAQHFPGDESIDYTSPFAGGNFSCITGDDIQTLKFDKFSYLNLHKIQEKLGGPQCGLDNCYSTEYFEKRPSEQKLRSLRSYLKEYREINEAALPQGAVFGIHFKTWNFNSPKFLSSLFNYLREKGVTVKQHKLSNISEAFFPDTRIAFNCTGLGARSLGGVEDPSVYPLRGQVLVIKAPYINENVLFWGSDYATYAIKRPFSNDQLVLGGFMQKNNWTADTFKSENDDILARTTKIFPEILTSNPRGNNLEDLEIVRSVAGLRPSRHGNVRIQKVKVDDKKFLVHNYGASGYGFQSGLGMAEEAVNLVLEASPKL